MPARENMAARVAACGLAQVRSAGNHVMPFILRGVAVLVRDSVMAPKGQGLKAWTAPAPQPPKVSPLQQEITPSEAVDTAKKFMSGKCAGATLST
jgi:hypothetical protein